MRFDTLAEWLSWQESLHPKTIDLGLGRVRRTFEALEGPPPPFTITVGGTNGKGSSVALLTTILRAAGYRVGTYTSPHLLRYNERIQIDGQPVGDETIRDAFARIDAARSDSTLSYFEFGTLAALDIFRRAGLDVQVLEVGLGGRLDAVNILDADAALVASIDIDHREWLGETREAIAPEKAGIFRPGRPAVVSDPKPPVSLFEDARARGIVLRIQNRDFGYAVQEKTWDWYGEGSEFKDLPHPALPGRQQFLNASGVLELLRCLAGRLPVNEAAIRAGLCDLQLPGRFQFFPGPPPLLLDVAHNPQAARVLAEYIGERFPGRRVAAVFAIMRDKDMESVIDAMSPLVSRWYLAPLRLPRAAPPETLQALLARRCGDAVVRSGFADAAQAFAAARREAAEDEPVVVFGSFFLVSEYLAHAASISR
jgi:dihydrofolate synthase/folylpolyglutamate synthase